MMRRPSLAIPARWRLGERMERLLRHPACALSCAAAIAALALVLVSARVLPLLGGIVATRGLVTRSPRRSPGARSCHGGGRRSRCAGPLANRMPR